MLLEREPSIRQVRIWGTLGIPGKPFVAFPGPKLNHPGNQAMHLLSSIIMYIYRQSPVKTPDIKTSK